jgi:thiol-disulfide isomerase/thioredoxin
MKRDARSTLGLLGVLVSSLLFSLLITGCSGGGLSKANENAFVSGSGSAVYIKASDRKPAPDLTGATLDGGKFTLARDRVAVINVWASWCSPCRAEAPLFQDFSKRYPSVQFVGILTRDNLTAARSFVHRFGLTYPSLVDDSLLTRFRGTLTANAIPTTLIIDSHGYMAARVSGEVTVALLRDLLTKVSGDPHVA